MAQQIFDNHGRPLTYLRLSVTDRCNLRCSYCMPHEHMDFVPRKELLNYEEMLRLVVILNQLGVKKVRITGGEPFVRKDIINFFESLASINGLDLHLTTNGVLTWKYIQQLKDMGIKGINLSLDTLIEEKFRKITRRNSFSDVLKSLSYIIEADIPLKINMVVIKGLNDDELVDMAQLSKNERVDVRFIEEMPFDGESVKKDFLNHVDIYNTLSSKLPLVKNDFKSTAQNYNVTGWKGSVGIIPAFSRTFCNTCNRIRINATGKLKTCLYGKDELDLKKLILSGASDQEISDNFLIAFNTRKQDGFEAERENQYTHQSMATIGG